MTIADLFGDVPGDRPEDRLPAAAPPGWTPGATWDGRTASGTITTRPLDGPPSDWSALLAERGLDPAIYEVDGSTVQWCSWDGWRRDTPDGNAYSALCYSFRATIRLRSEVVDDAEVVHLEQLAAEIRKTRPGRKRPDATDGTWIVCLSDWQIGNKDAGGVRTQLEAIAALPDLLVRQLRTVRRTRPVGHVVIAGMGDLVEGVCGHYPAQPFSVEANRREQMRIVRRGIYDVVRALAPLTDRMTLTAVGGNHGENRQNGKAITDDADNDDVAVFESVAERLAENPAVYGHVAVRLPHDRLAISIGCGQQIVAFTHGHKCRQSGLPINAVWEWWKGHQMGRSYPGVADAFMLITGHYHHLNVKAQEGRTAMICPSLTPVGKWWADTTGLTTIPGTQTVRVHDAGWDSLEVVR